MENELKGTEEKVTKTFEQMSESLDNLESSEEPVATEEPVAPEEPVATEEPKTKEPVAHEEPEAEDSGLVATIKPLLVKANNYSFLSCGRHLKNEINEENLKLFYAEFVAYGVSSALDIEVLAILRKAFK